MQVSYKIYIPIRLAIVKCIVCFDLFVLPFHKYIKHNIRCVFFTMLTSTYTFHIYMKALTYVFRCHFSCKTQNIYSKIKLICKIIRCIFELNYGLVYYSYLFLYLNFIQLLARIHIVIILYTALDIKLYY